MPTLATLTTLTTLAACGPAPQAAPQAPSVAYLRCLASRQAAELEVDDCRAKCPDGGRQCPIWRCSTREIEAWLRDQDRCVTIGAPPYAPRWPAPNTGTEESVPTGAATEGGAT